MMRSSVTVAAIIFGALVAGCATLPPGGDDMSYAQRRDHLAQIDTWELRGRIAVNTGEQAFQGRFQWSQHPERLALSVRGPLGTNVLRVSGPRDSLTIEARGEVWTLEAPESQLSELVGWWLPVTSFPSWLLGIPDPAYAARERMSRDGVLESLAQRLWQLDYASYQLVAGVLIPRRIDLRHDQLEFRIVVDSWQPSP